MNAATEAGTSRSEESSSYSPGPLISQQQRCNELTLDLPVGDAERKQKDLAAKLEVGLYLSNVAEAVTRLRMSQASIMQLLLQANLAKETAELERTLTKQTLTTSFGLYRRYHRYDMWRAKALVDDARRYGALARRAIEARYVVDLSAMNAPEALVSSPSSWADNIYRYDLNAPAAVGLAVGEEQGDGIYPNQIVDYVADVGT